jgi:2-keto-4-pentenoate hydratase
LPSKPPSPSFVAAQFVSARLTGSPLERYPGSPPKNLATAYAIQDQAIEMWPDDLGGWKIGLVPPAHRQAFGAERIAGPIFKAQIQPASDKVEIPVIPGGFAAAEAEFVIILDRDAPREARAWSCEEANVYAGTMHIGIEIAGSPFAGINDLGPAVTASDFGNNAGLIIGPAIADWRTPPLDTLTAETFIDGASVGKGSAAVIPNGPLAAVAFIIEHCARRGIRLRAGQAISTGATTGVHQIEAGRSIRADFGRYGAITCRATAAAPQRARKHS